MNIIFIGILLAGVAAIASTGTVTAAIGYAGVCAALLALYVLATFLAGEHHDGPKR